MVFERSAIPADGARVFFVRHGEVHNPGAIFYGRLPRYRLSERGQAQAAAAARALADEPLAAIFTSPLLRARQTGAALARAHPGVPVRRTRDILEIRSSLQGSPTADLDTHGWNFYEPLPHEDDETIAAIAARIERFCRLVAGRFPGQAVAAVTHGDILAVARARFEGWPLALASLRGEVYPATASILRVTFGAGLRAQDVGYLKPWQDDES